MGHRANYVVIERGETYIGFSRWGAQSIVADLLDGPRAATDAFRPPHPPEPPEPNTAAALMWRGPSPVDELMDDVYCEGAALIDHDRRELLAFQWPEDYHQFVGWIAALAETWPGWRVRWAFDGILDVAAYLGHDPGPLRRCAGMEPVDDAAALFPGLDPSYPDVSGSLSIRRPTGDIDVYLSYDEPTIIGAVSGAQLEALGPGLRAFTHTHLPRWGLHLEPAERTAGLWTIDSLEGVLRDPLPGWAGWTWRRWGGDVRPQLDACGGALRVPPLPAVLRHLDTVG